MQKKRIIPEDLTVRPERDYCWRSLVESGLQRVSEGIFHNTGPWKAWIALWDTPVSIKIQASERGLRAGSCFIVENTRQPKSPQPPVSHQCITGASHCCRISVALTGCLLNPYCRQPCVSADKVTMSFWSSANHITTLSPPQFWRAWNMNQRLQDNPARTF